MRTAKVDDLKEYTPNVSVYLFDQYGEWQVRDNPQEGIWTIRNTRGEKCLFESEISQYKIKD